MKKRIFALTLAAMMILVIFSGCGNSGDSEVIKIGTIDPMTGGSATYGQEKLNGMTLAVEDINAAGGVLGRELVLVSEDSGSQAAQAATVATKLITQDKVVAIEGAQTSSETMAILDVLAEYEIPAVAPATSPYIGLQGNMFINRCSPDDALQVEALLKYAAEELGYKTIGVMYSNDDYGKGGYDGAVGCADRYGITLVSDTFMGDDTNFSAQLTKMKDAGCEALLMWCQTTAASLIIKQADEMGWNPQYLLCPGVNDPYLFELTNGLCDGAIVSTSFYGENPDDFVQSFVSRYTEKYGQAPSLAAALGYDGILVIAEGIKAAGSTEPKAIAEAIRTLTDVQTLKGPASIDPETGNMTCPVFLVKANYATTSFDYYSDVEF